MRNLKVTKEQKSYEESIHLDHTDKACLEQT